ncbi:MAG TPA: copper chaperone PCu(A)C [Actinomycetota bacterium]
MSRRLAALVALLAATAIACGTGSVSGTTSGGLAGDPSPVVHVTGATITPTADGTATLVFGAHNAGGQTDRLVGVSCGCGGTATLLDAEGDPVDGVDIAPEETVFLGPGSATVELAGFDDPLTPDSFVAITVTFELAGDVQTDAEVAPEV